VAAKLKAAARRSGRAFRDVVNDTLRRGLMTERPGERAPFRFARAAWGAGAPVSDWTTSAICWSRSIGRSAGDRRRREPGALRLDPERGATLCSTDRDFARFSGLDWQNPITT
jgi:hypothetical protein